MKIRRLIVITGLLVVVAALASVALISHWQHSQPTFKSLPKLVTALKSYSRDHVSRGQPLPSSVTLRDLVTGGYISTEDVRAFDGMDVTIYPTSDAEPQAILVRVRMSDGSQFVATADGSVQGVSR